MLYSDVFRVFDMTFPIKKFKMAANNSLEKSSQNNIIINNFVESPIIMLLIWSLQLMIGDGRIISQSLQSSSL